MWRWLALGVVVACGPPPRNDGASDAATRDARSIEGDDGGGPGADASDADVVVPHDAALDAAVGVITGGPCSSGASGVTAYRIRWSNSGGTATAVYEVNGLPDTSPDHVAAYGYQIGFTPSYVDPYLAQGGLQLDGSDFVDIQLSTAGVAQIAKATLSIYGRSFNTTTSGSFNWQTLAGMGTTATNAVSNVAPYAWYSGDMTSELQVGTDNQLIRIKAGGSSGALVVNRIELCLQAS